MKFRSIVLILILGPALVIAENKPAPKPAPKPAAKPAPKPAAAKPKTPPKPQLSMRDLANAEAAKFDTNHNGKIEGTEVLALQNAYGKDPNGNLYLFDDDGDKRLSDSEIAKIKLPVGAPAQPAASPAATAAKSEPKPAAKPDAKPAAPAAKPAVTTPKPSPKNQPSMKELALGEAKKFDTNHNGKIEGTEVLEIQNSFAKNPGSNLYLFDDNGDKRLDDGEVAKIQLNSPAETAKPADPKKPTDPKAKAPSKNSKGKTTTKKK